MNTLLRRFTLYSPLRKRRQPQFFARHVVVGAGGIASLIALWIMSEVPETALPLCLWLGIGWLSGIVLFVARELPRCLPRPLRFLHRPRIVWIYGVLGIIAAAVLTHWITPLPEYRAFFRADALWVFYLPPLIYVARYGSWRQARRLLIFAVTLYAGLRLVLLEFEPRAVLTTFFLSALMVLLIYGAHQTIDSFRLQTARVDTLHTLTQEISNPHELRIDYDAFAKTIALNLDYAVVHILLWDANENKLTMGGAYGKSVATTKPIWVGEEEGLVGRCFHTRSYVVCNDTQGADGRQKGYVVRSGYEEIQSELAVPLTYGDEQLGVLDFQSSRRNEFDKADIAEARILARAISMAIKWKESTLAQELLWETLQRAQSQKTLEALTDEILDLVRQYLGASVITFYPLLPETELPRRAEPYRRGKLIADESGKGLDSFEPGARVYELVRAWQPHFAQYAERDRALRGDVPRDNDFIGREKIKSVIFLPLGDKSYKLGVLLVNYRARREFSPAVRAQLRAFGLAFALALRMLHERERANYVTRTGLHRNLSRYLSPIHAYLNRVRAAATRDPALIAQYLQELEQTIQQLRGRVARDGEGMFSEETSKLYDALYNAVSELRPETPPKFVAQIAPEIENLSPLLHAVLFDLAVEAMSNAVAHGHANSLRVHANLDALCRNIVCQIRDDGAQFDPEAALPSPDGIFAIKAWLERELNARIGFGRNEEAGMFLRAEIPILPLPDVVMDAAVSQSLKSPSQ